MRIFYFKIWTIKRCIVSYLLRWWMRTEWELAALYTGEQTCAGNAVPNSRGAISIGSEKTGFMESYKSTLSFPPHPLIYGTLTCISSTGISPKCSSERQMSILWTLPVRVFISKLISNLIYTCDRISVFQSKNRCDQLRTFSTNCIWNRSLRRTSNPSRFIHHVSAT